MNVQKLHELISSHASVSIIDVRTPNEFQEGHIPGAQNINIFDDHFTSKINSLDKNAQHVVHCASGGRAIDAVHTMESLGFSDVIHLDGDFTRWKHAGYPIVTT